MSQTKQIGKTITMNAPMTSFQQLGVNLLDSRLDKILVKFTVSNPKRVPVGIPEKVRRTDGQMDDGHQAYAKHIGRAELGEVGRVRDGRVDTGTLFLDDKHIQIPYLRVGFANVGYYLVDAHWFFKPARYGSKYVIVLTYKKFAMEPVKLAPATLEGVRKLARMSWGHCQGWDNTGCEVPTVTLNFGAPVQDDASPRRSITVCERQLVLTEVFGKNEEAA